MDDLPVCCAAEYADTGSLPAAVFFHEKICIKRVVAAGKKPDLAPATTAPPVPECCEVDFSNQGEINFVAHMRSDCGVPVPHILHMAQGSLSFAAHII